MNIWEGWVKRNQKTIPANQHACSYMTIWNSELILCPLVGAKSKDLGVWVVFFYCVADSKRGKDLKVHSPESDEILVRGGKAFPLRVSDWA